MIVSVDLQCNYFQNLMILTFSIIDKNDDSIRFMVHANHTSEWMCEIFLKFLMVYFVSLPAISVGSVFFCWFFYENLNVESFYHPFKIM